MKRISRRTLFGSVPLLAGAALSGASPKPASKNPAIPGNRSQPLDGIRRENLKITDLKVSLLSADLTTSHRLAVGGELP